MKRSLWFLPLIFIFAATMQAQEVPQVEISGGYSFLDANLGGHNGSSFHLHGAGTSATENFNNWFGGRLEFNAFSGTFSGTTVTAQTYTYPLLAVRASSPGAGACCHSTGISGLGSSPEL